MTRSRFLRFLNAISGFSGRNLSRRAAAIVLGAAMLALGAGEAEAQDSRVCDNAYSVLPAGTTEERARELSGLLRQGAIAESPHVSIYCRYGRADRRNRGFLVHNPQIVVVDDFVPGIEAFHEGVGDLSIFVRIVSGEPGTAGDFIHPSPTDYGQGIFTTGNAEDYITGEDSYGIHARHTGEGRAGIDVRNVSVRTTGDYSHGVYVWQQGSYIIRRADGSVVSGYVWDEDAGFFRRNDEDCSDCRSVRARGAVIVNLIETDRERDQRVRPLVATSGDNADALRAEYTRAAARGHIAVTVEGYALTTGGTLPLEALVDPQDPGAPLEVASPQDPSNYVFDPNRPSVPNRNYDPDDPSSPRFINVLVHRHRVDDAGNRLETVDLRPYTVIYLPRLNPDYDPDDPDSPRFVSGGNSDIAIWNGRYFVSQGAIRPEDVTACQGISTAEGRRACYENRVAARSEDNRPTGFNARGIYASHEGHGDIRIRVTDTNIRTGGADGIQTPGADAQGIYATHTGRTIVCGAPGSGCEVGGGTTPGGGGVSIVVTGGAIDTHGEDSHGIWARHRGDSGADEADGAVDPDDVGAGNVAIAVTDADIDTAGADARGVYGLIQQTCAGTDEDGNCNELVEGTGVGDIAIAVTGGSIDTAGVGGAYAVHALHENTGAIAVGLTGVAAATEGNQAHGVSAEHRGSAGDVSVTVDGGSIATAGEDAHGVYGAHAGSGDLSVGVMNGAAVTTKGIGAQGVRADHDGSGTLTVDVTGDVTTEGESSDGVLALHRGNGNLAIGMTGGAVKTTGFEAHGLYASHTGAAGTVSVTVSGGSVTAEDADSAGVLAHHGANEGAVTVSVGQGASVTGGRVGIQLSADADADGNVPTRTVRVDGTVRGVSGAGIHLPTGGVVNVGATGRVSGASVAIFSNGDVDVTVAGTVEGDVRADGDLTATIDGMVTGDVEGLGEGDHTVTVSRGGVVRNTIRLAASEVTLNGTAGRVLFEAGGTLTVGATGRITGVDGVAIQSDGGELTVNLNLASRRVADVLVGAIMADPDATTLLVNGETVNAGADAGNGAFDIRLSAGDGRLSLSEFYAPRAGLYEALPGLLLRLGGAQSKGERKTLPGSPVWASVLSGNGSRGKANSTVGAKYDFDQSGAEAGLGLSFPWVDGLRASLSIRQVNASANLSMGSGKGEIDLEGVGYAFGLSWKSGGGWYASGDLGLTDYAADFVSGSRGGLKHDVDASVRSLNLEAGRRLTLDRWAKRIALTPRVWVTRASVDVDDFTDSAGARFKLVEGDRLTGGAGVVAEAGFARGGGRLSLRGALDVETALSGEKTSVEVSGHRLHAEAEKTRFLMGVGARWRKGRFEIGGELNAAGLGSDDRTLGGRLNLGVQF